MESTHPSLTPPPCPLCGSRAKVVRMDSSLTPFERPMMREGYEAGHYYCTACTHDFEPEEVEDPPAADDESA